MFHLQQLQSGLVKIVGLKIGHFLHVQCAKGDEPAGWSMQVARCIGRVVVGLFTYPSK